MTLDPAAGHYWAIQRSEDWNRPDCVERRRQIHQRTVNVRARYNYLDSIRNGWHWPGPVPPPFPWDGTDGALDGQ